MAETLLTTSSIKLYGRVVTSLMYSDDTTDSILGSNNFLQKQLSQQQEVIEIFGDTEIGSSMINNVSPAGGQQRLLSLIGPGVKITGGGFPSDSFVKSVYTVEISDTTPVPEPEPPAGQRRRGGQDQARVPHSTTTRGFRIVIIANRQAEIVGETGAHVPVHLHLAVNFARIYAFSFEGSIYNLPKPSIFFVFGPGKGVDVQGFGGGRTDTNTSGVVAREWEFAGATGGFGEAGNVDLRYWEYEKGDFSIRFDTEAGPFEQILLMAALRAGADMADRTGVRSGASLAGASLSGASLSGASLSGASLSGASLSGASLRNGR